MSQNGEPMTRQGMQQVVQDYLEALLTEPNKSVPPIEDNAAEEQLASPAPVLAVSATSPEAEVTTFAPVTRTEQTTVSIVPPEEAVQPISAPQSVPAAVEVPRPAVAPAPPEIPVAVPAVAEKPAPQPAPQSAPQPAVVSAPIAAEKLASNGRIRCMLVKMHGLNLAIPSDFVESVLSLPDISLTLDAEHDWCLGSFDSQGVTTLLVDTALWLIPKRYDPALAQYHELIILQGRHWALSCDELVKSVDIPISAINWSAGEADRPWLWGTYMAERCALLNIQRLTSQFNQAI